MERSRDSWQRKRAYRILNLKQRQIAVEANTNCGGMIFFCKSVLLSTQDCVDCRRSNVCVGQDNFLPIAQLDGKAGTGAADLWGHLPRQ
eukprot:SAG31_NODE_3366_length_4358_cov_2.048133_7_plen_89_part_00